MNETEQKCQMTCITCGQDFEALGTWQTKCRTCYNGKPMPKADIKIDGNTPPMKSMVTEKDLLIKRLALLKIASNVSKEGSSPSDVIQVAKALEIHLATWE